MVTRRGVPVKVFYFKNSGRRQPLGQMVLRRGMSQASFIGALRTRLRRRRVAIRPTDRFRFRFLPTRRR